MAISLMIGALDRGPDDRSEAMVLIALADGADADSGETWPRVARIAERSRMTPRAVRLVLERLEQGGWLARERRSLANGRSTSTLYRLNVARLDPERAALRESMAAKRAAKGEAGSPRRGKQVHPRGEAGSPSEGEAGSPQETTQLKQGVRERAAGAKATAHGSLPECSGQRSPDQTAETERRKPGRRQLGELNAWQRTQVREGKALIVAGELVEPETVAHNALRAALQSVERGAA